MRHYQERECHRRLLSGAEERLGDSAVDRSCLSFGTYSSFQNICEFIGSTPGLIVLLKVGMS